jgi:phosphoenolpyruvate carboxylase
LLNDILEAAQGAAQSGSIINIRSVAEQVRQRHEDENVALEDIVEALMQQAQWLNLSVEFADEA